MIELKNIDFRYSDSSDKSSLSNINLKIKKGEVVLLCGESGCGKTTLTRLINGLIPHFYDGKLEGEVIINGENIVDFPLHETAKIVGSVFQNPRTQFYAVDTTSELAFACENQGLPKEEILARLSKTVERLNLKSLIGRSIFKLSGGEKQKIACASVSVQSPEIIVLDEPSSNLDSIAIDDLKYALEYWKNNGKTIIIAEHRIHYLKGIADRIIYMQEGKIVKEYNSRELVSLSQNDFSSLGLRTFDIKSLYDYEYSHQAEVDNKNFYLSDFCFAYKNAEEILHIKNATLPQNSIIAIIGDNGAGKSTLARCICGLQKKCGIIEYAGKSLKSKDRLKKCYMVMQDVNHQLFTESVLDEVLLSMNDKNETMADEMLSTMDLLPFRDMHPMSLSGGQKQRVAIASAIASDCDILVFDEPTSGLDLKHMKEVAVNLNSLQSLGKTLFIITHDPEFILSCCTHVLHLENGRIMKHYSMSQVGRITMLEYFKAIKSSDKIQTERG